MPMNCDIQPLGLEPSRERNPGRAWKINIKDTIAFVAIKMAMLPHIWTKPSRSPLKANLPHQAAFYQRIQAIIYRGHRNLGPALPGSNKNLLRGRMVPSLQQNVIHLLALRSKPKAAHRQALVQLVV